MYTWKNIKICIKNQKEASKIIGITSPYLCNICGGKIKINKRLAYFITKYIDEDAEIDDYFERAE